VPTATVLLAARFYKPATIITSIQPVPDVQNVAILSVTERRCICKVRKIQINFCSWILCSMGHMNIFDLVLSIFERIFFFRHCNLAPEMRPWTDRKWHSHQRSLSFKSRRTGATATDSHHQRSPHNV